MIGGVSGGLAEYFNIDILAVRIVFVILTLFAASKGEGSQHGLKIEKLNDKYREMADKLRSAISEQA